MQWELFLRQMADDFSLSAEQTDVFLVRFSEKNSKIPESAIAEDLTKYLKIAIDIRAYRKRMKGVYEKFALSKQTPNGCKAIAHKGPHKQKQLLTWLHEKFSNLNPQSPAKEENGHYYVQRPPTEELCYSEMLQSGSLIRIKAPKRMGKTFLIDNLLHYAKNQGYCTVRWDGLQVDKTAFEDLGKFWHLFCNYVGRQLNVENRIKDFWDEELGQNNSCSVYFEEYLLKNLESPLVLGLDNFDRLFPPAPIFEEVCALFRFWHEEAKRSNVWKKLRLVLAHSTDIYAYPQLDMNRSPFNVGLPIELREFTSEEIQELAKQYSLEKLDLTVLQKTIGGHPYLVQIALKHIHNYPNQSLEQIMQAAITEKGLYRSYLRELLDRIEQDKKLIEAIKNVIESENPVQISQDEAFKLYSLGVIVWEKDAIKLRCQLYRSYLRKYLSS